jgi:hypothetical protein
VIIPEPDAEDAKDVPESELYVAPFPPETRKTSQLRYLITEPQLHQVERAGNRQQIWEGVGALFSGLWIGAFISCLVNWSPLWGLACVALGLVTTYTRRQVKAWEKVRAETMEAVRLTEYSTIPDEAE